MAESNAPSADDSYLEKVMEAVLRVGLILLLLFWCFNIIRPFITPSSGDDPRGRGLSSVSLAQHEARDARSSPPQSSPCSASQSYSFRRLMFTGSLIDSGPTDQPAIGHRFAPGASAASRSEGLAADRQQHL